MLLEDLDLGPRIQMLRMEAAAPRRRENSEPWWNWKCSVKESSGKMYLCIFEPLLTLDTWWIQWFDQLLRLVAVCPSSLQVFGSVNYRVLIIYLPKWCESERYDLVLIRSWMNEWIRMNHHNLLVDVFSWSCCWLIGCHFNTRQWCLYRCARTWNLGNQNPEPRIRFMF